MDIIEDFSRSTKPLSDILPHSSTKKGKKLRNVKQWKWGNIEQDTFQLLKNCLTSPAVLGYPCFDKPFELHTDASGKGLGAVLYQED